MSNDDSSLPHADPKTGTTSTSTSPSPPRRFIYDQNDMQKFRSSPIRRELLSFVTALGRSTITSSYAYDGPSSPEGDPAGAGGGGGLEGLSPGTASLHGSLRCMAEEWIGELPPDEAARARFGNPVFKDWHGRLSGDGGGGGSGGRSGKIVAAMMDCHLRYTVPVLAKEEEWGKTKDASASTDGDADVPAEDSVDWDISILERCSEAGYRAASSTSPSADSDSDVPPNHDTATTTTTSKHDRVLQELCSYFNLSFGHPIRIDYGTGHESSFLVFLFSLCKIGIFGNHKSQTTPGPDTMAPVALSVLSQYLHVCRGLQTRYMLEPAGSHGVWGLDDYHCVPFYVGACQLQNPRFSTKNGGEGYAPSDVHDDRRLASEECAGLMYFQCIRYVKSIKRGVPFFESSPMLDDISRLGSWGKVGAGLSRLYEGEVLDKLPVVQHFVFGDIFRATWTPSDGPRAAPSRNFTVGVGTGDGAAAMAARNDLPMQSTKAPWAK